MSVLGRVKYACLGIALIMSTSAANAALMNYTITGDVWFGDDPEVNFFGLNPTDTITATGVFEDDVLTTDGSGTISFGAGSGNSMTLTVGFETYTASNDQSFLLDGSPHITLSNFALTDLDFFALAGTNGANGDFNSYFLAFDDLDVLYGEWRTTVEISAVPVPAAAWLFGSGLLALFGFVRRKK